MTPEQIDDALEELAVRLERVRSLYEQYFMGIERLEPTIPRKDLERRLFDLRKTRFQNTAKRFKFQTLVQRYNSLQQYWYRTCRDIENGTYRKHVLRAERRFGKLHQTEAPSESQSEPAEERPDLTTKARERAAADMGNLLEIDVDLDAEWEKAIAAADPASVAPQAAGSIKTSAKSPRVAHKLELPPLGKARDETRVPQERGSQNSVLSSLKDLGALQNRPSLTSGLKAGPRPEGLGAPSPSLTNRSKAPAEGPKVSPPPVVLRQSSRPPPPLDKAAAAPVERSIPVPSRKSPQTAPGKPGSAVAARSATASSPRSSAQVDPPTARERMKTLPGANDTATRATGTLATAKSPSPAVSGKMAERPSAPKPLTARRPAEPSIVSSTTSTGKSSTLSEERIRLLHQKYSEARKQTQATSVSYEKLSKSIRETERKLRSQHGGRQVDFDVTIKDGKAILKPKLK